MMEISGPSMFIVFMISFYIFYVFFVDRDIYRNFFVVVLIVIFLYYPMQNGKKTQQELTMKNDIFDRLEKDIQGNGFLFKKMQYIYKPPRKLRYIKKDDKISDIVVKLERIRVYDNVSYLTFVVLMENFLKIHFNIMLGKYDIKFYGQSLLDVRTEIMNTLYGIYFNIPRFSTIIDIDNIESYVYDIIILTQAVLYKYTKTLKHKASKHSESFQATAPLAYDTMVDNAYDIM